MTTADELASTDLLEREDALRTIGRAVDAAAAGQGRLIVLEGAAGIGKTRLLRASLAAAAAAGLETLAARAAERERDFAFGTVLQLLQLRVVRASADERAELLAGPAALATPLLLPADAQPEPSFSVLHGLFWLTYRLAGDRGLVVAVDDLQWADAPSLRYLLYLVQRLDELAVAVVVATRPGEGGENQDLVDELLAHPDAQIVRPQPLSDHAVADVVRRTTDGDAADAFCRACAEATGGNPFLLHELLGALALDGVGAGESAADRVRRLGSASVARAVLVRLARLPRQAAAVARAAAVLDEAPLAIVAAVAGLDEAEAAGAADGLASVEVLREGPRVEFVHPLVRHSIEADLPPHERARLHRRAAQVLADAGERERAAAHLLQTDASGGDAWVVEMLRAAAERAEGLGAPETAVRLLRRALAEPPAPGDRADVLVALGHAEAAAGESTALERLHQAWELVEEPARVAEIGSAVGRTLFAHGRFSEAAAAFEEARGSVDPGSATGRELRAALIQARVMGGSPPSTAEVEELVAEVLPSGRPSTQVERMLLALLAMHRLLAGVDAPGIVELCLRALDDGALLATEGADGMTYHLLTGILGYCGRLDLALPVLDAALADARRRGSILGFATASFARSGCLFERAELREALADAEAAVASARYGWRLYLPLAWVHVAGLRLELDDLDGARDALAEVPGDLWHGNVVSPTLYSLRGERELAAGEAEAAVQSQLTAGEMMTAIGTSNPAILAWRSQAARALLRLGRREEAVALAEEELALARRFGAEPALGIALAAAGVTTGGDTGLAYLEEAVSLAERSWSRLELPRTLIDLGTTLRRSGRPAQAREPLRRAVELATGWDLPRTAAQAAEALREAGGRARRRGYEARDQLTAGELRVARLAAAGRSNREIAQELFVTPKAVEWHLGNAYRKLGIGSRRQLDAALEAS